MMIKEALRLWEEKTGKKPAESAEVKLNGMFPSIEKMDSALNQLVCCQASDLTAPQAVGSVRPSLVEPRAGAA
ncbi:Dynein light chain 1, axonemal [Amphibalanus amphitrite]|uniref:Dynein light chain 1, axonemal n=1 Tax=Amphibalanus amphitrite TaxID=1232801 RepID=A0A6A4VYF9_AMPAM|nr:Dynein light chain 1, axonemal [Amphibalanus amphitrite]